MDIGPSWPAHSFSHILLPAVSIFHILPNRFSLHSTIHILPTSPSWAVLCLPYCQHISTTGWLSPKTNPDQAPRSQFVLASYWSGAKFKFSHWQSPNFTHTHFIEQYQLTWPYLSQLAIHLAFYTLPVDLLTSFPHSMCSITRLQDLKKSLPSFVITKFQQHLHQPQSTTKIHSPYLGCPTPTFGIINQDNMASSTPTNITTSIPSTSTNMAPSDSKS